MVSHGLNFKHFQWIRIHLSYGLKCIISGIFIELNTKVDILMIGFFLKPTKASEINNLTIIYSFLSFVGVFIALI